LLELFGLEGFVALVLGVGVGFGLLVFALLLAFAVGLGLPAGIVWGAPGVCGTPFGAWAADSG
jgi:hypothetical protein